MPVSPVEDTPVDTKISVDNLTNTSNDGVFDVLFEKVQSKVMEEFSSGRIQGTDYANVLLGSLSVTMEQSIQFCLQRVQAARSADLVLGQIQKTDQESLALEIGNTILEEQLAGERAMTILKKQQYVSEKSKTSDKIKQVNELGEFAAVETDIEGMQGKEAAILATRLLTEKEQTKVARQQFATEKARTSEQVYQAVLNEAGDLIQAPLSSVAGVVAKEKDLVASQKEASDAQTVLLNVQKTKTEQEAHIMRAKRTTEEAQFTDTPKVYSVDAQGTEVANTLTEVLGVVGIENALREAQAKGFAMDGQQKLLKLYLDAIATGLNANNVPEVNSAGFTNATVKDLVDFAHLSVTGNVPL